MEHDLFHHTFAQIKGTKNTVAVFLLYHPFGAADLERPRDFLAHGKDVAVGVDGHAEKAQDAADQKPHG